MLGGMSAYEDLTELQRKFVEAYLLSGNASEAYEAAGYKGRGATARVNASRMLTNANIQSALAERRAQLASAYDVTPERVIAELALIGFSDIHSYLTWGPGGVTLRDSSTLDPNARRVVSEVSQTITQGGGSIKFKLYNKVEALEKLGTHLGLWKTQTVADALEWLQTVHEGRDRLQAQLTQLAMKAQTNGHHDDTPDEPFPGA